MIQFSDTFLKSTKTEKSQDFALADLPCLKRALSSLLRRFDYADSYTVVLCVQDKAILQ